MSTSIVTKGSGGY